MKIYYIPLETIDMRYTKGQDDITQKTFKELNIKYKLIDGKVLSNKKNPDEFLNPTSTSYFKFNQLEEICKLFNNNKIKNGDIFYVSDIWFPGIESIKYMAYFKNISIQLYGVLHAGSFTPTDTVEGMKEWARPFELSLIKMFDGIFLGSEQTRQDLLKTFNLGYTDLKKLHITGLSYDSKEVEKYNIPIEEKEDIILFPHRLHLEKQEYMFDNLKQYFPNIKFISTHRKNLSKEELYKLMAKSKIIYSASLQENFGYSVLEGCSLGVNPILPNNNTCYKYMYPKKVLYNNFEESIELIKKYLNKDLNLKYIPRYYDDSLKRQINIIIKNERLLK